MIRDYDPEGSRLPIKVDSTSNGEYVPVPLSAEQDFANRFAQERVGQAAKKVGKNRRAFLKSSAGAAATLLAFNDAHARTGARGGFFDIPRDAALDNKLAASVVGGDEFIFDIQTHCVDPSGEWRKGRGGERWYYQLTDIFKQGGHCSVASLDCLSAQQLVKDVYLDSDTDMGVISALPGWDNGTPTPMAYAAEAQAVVKATSGGKRTLLHGGVMPNLPGSLDFMEVQAREYNVAAWKLYPQWGPDGVGFHLDSEEYGIPFIEKARALGIKVVCAHRGLPMPYLMHEHSSPADMARAAKLYPDVTFITYHSGFEPGKKDGAYDPDDDESVNRLIKAHQEAGFKRNQGNLYAELGAVWQFQMSRPDAAAHLIGKLIKYMGEDRICWGTDCIFFGSPQDQIQAMRTFQISDEFQEEYGYPEITPEIRAKIFGLNAAVPYKVDVPAVKKAALSDDFGRLRAAYREDPNPSFLSHGPKTRREFFQLMRANGGLPG